MKAIVTKYLGPTDYRGSRIVATAEGGNRPHRIVVSYDDSLSGEACHRAAADALCARLGWDSSSLVGGGLPNGRGYAFCFAASLLGGRV